MRLLLLAPLHDWTVRPDLPYTPAEGVTRCWVDEESALTAANELYRDQPGPFVALTVEEALVNPEESRPVPRQAVSEVRHVRRDPLGRFVAVERRPQLAETLDLLPHPEGGWYRETWASPVRVTPEGYDGTRASATAIYFLLQPGDESCWHSVRSDELWLWHRGGVLDLIFGGAGARPDAEPRTIRLGPDLEGGEAAQVLVPAGTWQSARPATTVEALVSCVVSPGFDFADFRAL